MDLEFEEIDFQAIEFSGEVSSSDQDGLLEMFDQTNRRLNGFLGEKVLAYQKDEMAITIFPIASFIVARMEKGILGYAAFFDNYLMGIFVSGSFSDRRLEALLLEKVKDTLSDGLETNVFMRNSRMLELYLEEGFNISAWRNCWRCNEITVTLTYERALTGLTF